MLGEFFKSIDQTFSRFSISSLNTLSIIAVAVFIVGISARYEEVKMSDLPQYLAGAKLIKEGRSPYSAVDQKNYQIKIAPQLGYNKSNLYLPPNSLPLLYFLDSFTFSQAKILYIVIFFSILLFICSLFLKRELLPVSLAIAIASVSFTTCLRNGQITILLFLFYCLHLYFYRKNRLFLSGLCLSITFFKPQIFLLYYLFILIKIIQRKYFAIFYGTSLGVMLPSLVITLFYPDIWQEYLVFLSEADLLHIWDTVSLYTLLITQHLEPLAPVISIVGLVLVGFLALSKKVDSWEFEDQLVVALLLSVTACPYYWVADTLICFAAILLSLKYSSALLVLYLLSSILELFLVAFGMEYQSLYFRMPITLIVVYLFFSYFNLGENRQLANSEAAISNR